MTATVLSERPLTPGTCEWCGAPCHTDDTTCGLKCEAALVMHEKRTARHVLRELKLWRMHRGRVGTPGQGIMTKMSALTDALLKEDRARRKMMTKARQQEKGS